MTPKDQLFLQKWERTLEEGRLKYAIKEGLTLGIIVFIISNLLDMRYTSFAEEFLTTYALVDLVTWIVGAILGYFTIMWWFNNYLYKQKKGA